MHGHDDDDPRLRVATPGERVALARVLSRLAGATTDRGEIAGFVAAALQQLAVVLDHDRRDADAALLRDCAARLEGSPRR